MKLTIRVKKFSRRENQIASLVYEYPDTMTTVRDLLAETVKRMVDDYVKRMNSGDALKVLTEADISDQSVSGKIGFGKNYGKKRPDTQHSIQAAWECFEDGIVVVFADGVRLEKLEEQLAVRDGSELTFVRMTFLAGRMW